ncbi:MAG: hypothetical protein BWY94_00921 [Actinobacteria bacterium ADurb.BinA094]|nr:MAG: hypothetical protein BWY94_00921 [Actinobacteria bacterium ADurb.BinA094]
MRLLLLAADAGGGALLGAEHAAGAQLGVDVVGDQRLALAGRAALLADVRLVLVAEVLDRREHRIGGGAAQRAERALDHVTPQLLEQLDVSLAPLALDDTVERLEHAFGAEAAGDALAAALVLGELEEETRQVDHAGLVVDHDHAAGADDGAGRGQRLVVDRRVEQAGRHAAAGGAAELDGLELAAVLDAAADVEDDLAQGGAHRHLGEAAVDQFAGEAEGLGAAAVLGAELVVLGGAVGDDPGHVGPGLDVVDVGGAAPEAGDGGEGRTGARHAALALDRGDQRGLLAADEGAGAELEVQVELPARTEDVASQEPALLGIGDRLGEALDGQRVLGAHVDVALVGADCPAADQHALDDRVRVALEDRAVHERAGVALVGVADEVLDVALALVGELPLDAGREPGAAAAADARVGDLLDDLLLGHRRERRARRLVAAAGEVLVEALRVDHAHVAQGDARLGLVEPDVVPVADALAGLGVLVEEALHRTAVPEVLVDHLGHVPRLEMAVQRVVAEHGDRAHGAQAVTADDADVHLVGQAGLPDLLHERVVDGHRAGEHAGGAGADLDGPAAVGTFADADVAGVVVRARCRGLVGHGLSAHPFVAPTCSMRSRMIRRVLSGVRPP